MKRRLLLCYIISFVSLALLYLLAMCGMALRDSVFEIIGFAVAWAIVFPGIVFFGTETHHFGIALTIAAFIDVNILALSLYYVWRERDRMPV